MFYASFISNYLIPVSIFVGLAIILGFGLAFLSEKLNVKKDVRFDEVRKLLSGTNCGGCGYPGCDAFAEALLTGEAKVEGCRPTSAENKAGIAEILGVSIENGEPRTVVVHCAGGNRCKDKGGYIGYGDCKSAGMLSGGTKACSVGCMGLGSCVDECAFEAISVDKKQAHAYVDKSHCVACGACLKECPKKLVGFIPKSAKVFIACSNHSKGKDVSNICFVGCIGCGVCAKVCKFDAIRMDNNLPVIDYKNCTGCGECADKCPRKTIVKR